MVPCHLLEPDGARQFELAAPSRSTIETYFYGSFGSDIRDTAEMTELTPNGRRRDGRFHIGPADDEDLAYLELVDDADQPYLALYDQDQVIAVDGFDEDMATIRLTDLAVYLSVDNDEIKAAFTDNDGLDSNREPLLIVDDDEGEGTGVDADEGSLSDRLRPPKLNRHILFRAGVDHRRDCPGVRMPRQVIRSMMVRDAESLTADGALLLRLLPSPARCGESAS